jgi:hypothetical protein
MHGDARLSTDKPTKKWKPRLDHVWVASTLLGWGLLLNVLPGVAKMTAIGDKELEEIYAFALQVTKDAAQILKDSADPAKRGGGSGLQISEKESAVDIVTKTDNGMVSRRPPRACGSLY